MMEFHAFHGLKIDFRNNKINFVAKTKLPQRHEVMKKCSDFQFFSIYVFVELRRSWWNFVSMRLRG